MERMINNPESLLIYWLGLGLVLGLTLGLLLNSLTIGMPLGLVTVLWAATIMQRLGRRMRR